MWKEQGLCFTPVLLLIVLILDPTPVLLRIVLILELTPVLLLIVLILELAPVLLRIVLILELTPVLLRIVLILELTPVLLLIVLILRLKGVRLMQETSFPFWTSVLKPQATGVAKQCCCQPHFIPTWVHWLHSALLSPSLSGSSKRHAQSSCLCEQVV